MSVELFSLNIEADRHLDVITAYLQRTLPDVICLQEVYKVHATMLAKTLGYELLFAPHVNFTKPEHIFSALGEWGICILVKYPVRQKSTAYYGEKGTVIPDHFMDTLQHPRALISVSVMAEGKEYVFATTHFTWAMPENADIAQAHDLQKLEELLDQMPSFVLSGDMNATRRTKLYQELSTTYHAWLPLSVTSTLDPMLFRKPGLELVVDHLFSTSDYVLTNVEVLTGLSDHCALTAIVDKLT